jgi:hypothetical protein
LDRWALVLLGDEPGAGRPVRMARNQTVRMATAGVIAFLIIAAVLGWCAWTLRR